MMLKFNNKFKYLLLIGHCMFFSNLLLAKKMNTFDFSNSNWNVSSFSQLNPFLDKRTATYKGGTDVGGSDGDELILSQWGGDVPSFLNLTLIAAASSLNSTGSYMAANKVLLVGLGEALLKSKQAINSPELPLTQMSLERFIKLSASFNILSSDFEDDKLKIHYRILIKMYHFILDDVLSFDLSTNNVLMKGKINNIALTRILQQKFKTYIIKQLTWVNCELAIKSYHNGEWSVVDTVNARSYLLASEAISFYTAKDIQRSSWSHVFSGEALKLYYLYNKLKHFNHGHRQDYKDERIAEANAYHLIEQVLTSLIGRQFYCPAKIY